MINAIDCAEKLVSQHSLSVEEYECLLNNRTPRIAEFLRKEANAVRQKIYSDKIYIRGLIEISNICKNDCFYCGIRKSNHRCKRYRLSPDEIINCCKIGYGLGFRTFVLQGGEDAFFTDSVICDTVYKIKSLFPDCAVTLSLGERSFESYKNLKDAGADRYLLRQETVDYGLYGKLHPDNMSVSNRIQCLKNLRDIGYQVGCGFMAGVPHQTNAHIARDLKFTENFKPDMCGIGPFIPHKDTPFGSFPSGSVELTCFLLSVIRLIHPPVLLPATTALGTAETDGREKGILCGANVVMPNLSPENARKNYELYNNKLSTGAENAFKLDELRKKIDNIGFKIVTERGDVIK